MIILMKQTFSICIYSAESKWDLNSGWNKISFKKNCSHGKVPILMKYFLQESKNQTYHSKVWPNVCSSRGRRVVERKQVGVGLGEKKSYQ